MAAIRQDKPTRSARISTTFTYNRVKEIASLNLPALHRTHSAGDASVASTTPSCTTSEKEERLHISADEPCFITRKPGYALQKAHWINAVRKNPPEKVAVERFLNGLSVVRREFSLNSASNLTPLDPTLHYTMDKLGFFAVTCSKVTLKAMIEVVDAENKIFDEDPMGYTRYFKIEKEPFSNAEYEMVVLHPDHFLPIGSTLAMHTQDPNNPARLVGKLYMASADGALRETSNDHSPRFPAFRPTCRLEQKHCLNPFLVVLNAAMAFRRYMKTTFQRPAPLCTDYRDLVDLTLALADKIYHKPVIQVALQASSDARQLAIMKMPAEEAAGNNEEMVMGNVDRFGSMTRNGEDKTLAPKGRGRGGQDVAMRSSRFGAEVEEPLPDASREDIVDYCHYLISGRDEPLSRKDEAILASIGLYPVGRDNDNDDELSDSEDDEEEEWMGEECVDAAPDTTVTVAEKVLQWQSAADKA
ncbi:hypothetical protein NLJ89_g8640 [Agrocybe chaxingu]|uniref:Uncharacterized protein n=1 Tax=Agrocybe chaxingu TaxID=84603 RepID=A0A9W8JUY3_9AGAR|nr:hypothetical protein NLJ89_g8640 [Agrocybe chaxingu]